MNLKDTYKGYTISYNGRNFEILLEDKVQTRRPKDPEACMAWVDKQLKEEFIRTSVIVSNYRDGFREAEATSVVEAGVWVVYADGKRAMVEAKDLRVLSEDNLSKVVRYEELKRQAEVLREEAGTVKASLEVFDVSSMIKYRK